MSEGNIKVLVALAEGFEEVEALTPIDLLRRAGFTVVVAGVDGTEIVGTHNITVKADIRIEDAGTDFDAMILPGGGLGSKNLANSWEVNEKMLMIVNSGGILAAICAAPAVVLGPAGLLEGHKAVCYPGAETNTPGFAFGTERVCVDGSLITARAVGCSIEFSLAIIEKLAGSELKDQIAKRILFK
jgi:4-methyl-5(b-hydroxyethyl)-thiazole monophosphate biosynthesis